MRAPMKMLALALLVPALAAAQGVTKYPPGKTSTIMSLPLSSPGCYPTGTGAGNGKTFTVVRATGGTYYAADGSVQTCAANEMRVGCASSAGCTTAAGAVIEPARWQYVLNSTTHPKAAQATGTLPVGDFVARHAGVGNMTIAAGTATVTGLSCAGVAPGTLCTFTVTVTGTMLVTTAAGVTRAQIEGGAYPTMWIDSGGANTSRAADKISVPNPLKSGTQAFCISGLYTFYKWNTGTPMFWSLEPTVGGANTAYARTIGDSMYGRIYDAAGAEVNRYAGSVFAATANNSTHRVSACYPGTKTVNLLVDGVQVDDGTTASAGTGIITTQTTTLYLGTYGTAGSEMGGFLRGFKVCESLSGACR